MDANNDKNPNQSPAKNEIILDLYSSYPGKRELPPRQ